MKYIDRLKQGAKNEKPAREDEVHSERKRRVVRDILPPESLTRRTRPLPVSPVGGVTHPQGIPATPSAEPTPTTPRPRSVLRSSPPPMVRESHQFGDTPAERAVPEPNDIVDQNLPIPAWENAVPQRSHFLGRFSIAGGAAIVLIAFGVTTFAFPKFELTLYPKVNSISLGKIDLVADTTITEVDTTARKAPAIIIDIDRTLSQDYPASGSKNVQVRAHGTVVIMNNLDSSPRRLVQNTRLQDPTGKIFRLSQGITIPGANVSGGKVVPASVNALVVADQPGDTYNIGPTTFRIPGFQGTPKYDGYTAKSDTTFTGGFTGLSKVITPDDLASASQDLTKRVVDELRADLDAKVPADPDFLAPPGSRETVITSVNQPKAGEAGDRFTLTVSGRGRVLAIKKSDVRALVLSQAIPGADASMKTPILQNDLVISASGPGTPASPSHLTISGALRYYHEPKARELIDVLKTSTPKKAEAYLHGREEIDSFSIKRFPLWLWFIPGRASGLTVTITPPA